MSEGERRPRFEHLRADQLNQLMRMTYLLNQAEGKDIPPPPYIRRRSLWALLFPPTRYCASILVGFLAGLLVAWLIH